MKETVSLLIQFEIYFKREKQFRYNKKINLLCENQLNLSNLQKMKRGMRMKEKEIKVLKVKPHEHHEVYMLKNTLEAMQEAVGGYIDIVGLEDNVCIPLNDEGKIDWIRRQQENRRDI